MDLFYRQLERLALAGEPAAAATVIAARGSTPRGVGARMIVRRDGAVSGSIGGGCGEALALEHAMRVIDDGRPRLCEVDLTGDIGDETPTHCGGIMQVFVEPASAGPALLLRAAGHAHEPVALIASLGTGERWLVGSDGTLRGEASPELAAALRVAALEALAEGASRRARIATTEIFVEVVEPVPQLVIAGAGHIAQPLCRMAKELDFEVAVVDDRAAFANRARFPQADEVLVGPIAEVLAARGLGPASYLALVTRGHQHDEAALKVALGSRARYIGMIGSRRRVREVFRHLAAAGVPQELCARVQAPIGLDIGATTPAEIAVAIVAQIVQARTGAAPARRLVLVKGAGDLATGCAVRLHRAGFGVAMTELAAPSAVRRTVAFSEAVLDGAALVEGVCAERAADAQQAMAIIGRGHVAVLVDPEARLATRLHADIVLDARMAKRNPGTSRDEAPVVIALGPGFHAGRDVDAVIETQRGHALGAMILEGEAEPNTGVPGEIAGKSLERLLRAPASGVLRTRVAIGDTVAEGALVGEVAGEGVRALTGGVVRGLLRDGAEVRAGQKIGDVDPRARRSHCFSVSDKARAVAGGVLEAILYFSSTAKPRSASARLPTTTRSSRGEPRAINS